MSDSHEGCCVICGEIAPRQALCGPCGEAAYMNYIAPQHEPSHYRRLYYELLYAVEKNYPDESRHETALRYIKQHSSQTSDFVNMEAKISKNPVADSESEECPICGGTGIIGQMGSDNTDIFYEDCYACGPGANYD